MSWPKAPVAGDAASRKILAASGADLGEFDESALVSSKTKRWRRWCPDDAAASACASYERCRELAPGFQLRGWTEAGRPHLAWDCAIGGERYGCAVVIVLGPSLRTYSKAFDVLLLQARMSIWTVASGRAARRAS